MAGFQDQVPETNRAGTGGGVKGPGASAGIAQGLNNLADILKMGNSSKPSAAEMMKLDAGAASREIYDLRDSIDEFTDPTSVNSLDTAKQNLDKFGLTSELHRIKTAADQGYIDERTRLSMYNKAIKRVAAAHPSLSGEDLDRMTESIFDGNSPWSKMNDMRHRMERETLDSQYAQKKAAEERLVKDSEKYIGTAIYTPEGLPDFQATAEAIAPFKAKEALKARTELDNTTQAALIQAGDNKFHNEFVTVTNEEGISVITGFQKRMEAAVKQSGGNLTAGQWEELAAQWNQAKNGYLMGLQRDRTSGGVYKETLDTAEASVNEMFTRFEKQIFGEGKDLSQMNANALWKTNSKAYNERIGREEMGAWFAVSDVIDSMGDVVGPIVGNELLANSERTSSAYKSLGTIYARYNTLETLTGNDPVGVLERQSTAPQSDLSTDREQAIRTIKDANKWVHEFAKTPNEVYDNPKDAQVQVGSFLTEAGLYDPEVQYAQVKKFGTNMSGFRGDSKVQKHKALIENPAVKSKLDSLATQVSPVLMHKLYNMNATFQNNIVNSIGQDLFIHNSDFAQGDTNFRLRLLDGSIQMDTLYKPRENFGNDIGIELGNYAEIKQQQQMLADFNKAIDESYYWEVKKAEVEGLPAPDYREYKVWMTTKKFNKTTWSDPYVNPAKEIQGMSDEELQAVHELSQATDEQLQQEYNQ